jgi:hypothetical protein
MTIELSVVRGQSPVMNAKTQSRKDAEAPSELSRSNGYAGTFDAMTKPLKIGDYAKFRSEMPGITAYYGIIARSRRSPAGGGGNAEQRARGNFPVVSTYFRLGIARISGCLRLFAHNCA